ncbi:hypothetical protein V1477_020738 [Vespula maculifrons]|uniref:Uncharacterized protein n=1 Tax=Vespula maculifrons TaxID=7453 RepID=A0ABD2AMS3_VESMC
MILLQNKISGKSFRGRDNDVIGGTSLACGTSLRIMLSCYKSRFLGKLFALSSNRCLEQERMTL